MELIIMSLDRESSADLRKEHVRKVYDQNEPLNTLASKIHKNAIEKGFHSDDETEDQFIERSCNNFHDEVSELHEAWRNNKLRSLCDKAENMEKSGIEPLTNLEEELADIIIRVLDASAKLKINIDSAIDRKMKYNKTRTYRHGNKRS